MWLLFTGQLCALHRHHHHPGAEVTVSRHRWKRIQYLPVSYLSSVRNEQSDKNMGLLVIFLKLFLELTPVLRQTQPMESRELWVFKGTARSCVYKTSFMKSWSVFSLFAWVEILSEQYCHHPETFNVGFFFVCLSFYFCVCDHFLTLCT